MSQDDFEAWVKSTGTDPASLDETQRVLLRKAFDATRPKAPAITPPRYQDGAEAKAGDKVVLRGTVIEVGAGDDHANVIVLLDERTPPEMTEYRIGLNSRQCERA
jgi:hypothetical protein